MNYEFNWVEFIIWAITAAILVGIGKQKVDDLTLRVTSLETDTKVSKETQHTMQLNAVNSPTKSDINHLTSEIHQLKLSIVRFEVILEHLATQHGIKTEALKHHKDS